MSKHRLDGYIKEIQDAKDFTSLWTIVEHVDGVLKKSNILEEDNKLEDLLDAIDLNYFRLCGEGNAVEYKDMDGKIEPLPHALVMGPINNHLSPARKEMREIITEMDAYLRSSPEMIQAFQTYKTEMHDALRAGIDGYSAAKTAGDNLEKALDKEPGIWGKIRPLMNRVIQLVAMTVGIKEGAAVEGKYFPSKDTRRLQDTRFNELKDRYKDAAKPADVDDGLNKKRL